MRAILRSSCAHTKWRQRPRRIHTRAANRPGKHRFQQNDAPDGQARKPARFPAPLRYPQNNQHQQESQYDFQYKRLRGTARRECCTERCIGREQKMQQAAGDKCSKQLARHKWCDAPSRKTPGSPECHGYRRVQVRPRYLAQGINHGHNDQAECDGYADMCHHPAAFLVDDDGARAAKHQRECAEQLGKIFLHDLL